jgi:uncharacterized membrane protein
MATNQDRRISCLARHLSAASASALTRTFDASAQDAVAAAIEQIRVVPVVALDSDSDAVPLARALAKVSSLRVAMLSRTPLTRVPHPPL